MTIDDPSATERFLHDFQLTCAELIEENYYRHFHNLCTQNGLKSHAEVIYGGTGYPPLDILKSNSYVDVPMFEFWATPDKETGLINYKPVEKTAFPMPAHAGALYGKNIVPAEAYTGYANYSEYPGILSYSGIMRSVRGSTRWFFTAMSTNRLRKNRESPSAIRPEF